MNPQSPKKQIRFYFDFISHNAYLAWHKLPEIAQRENCEIKLIPVLFAGLLNAHGQLGPAEILPKVRWMAKDVIRKAKLLGIPMNPPASHPFNPLLPLRVSCLPMPERDRMKLVDALFKATWAESLDVGSVDVVSRIATGIGLDGPALVAHAKDQENKERLILQTDEAIEAGVFGVPTMIVDGELFWGYDNLPFLELFLKGQDPITDEDMSGWLEVKPSAQRRRPQSNLG
jgi:2-hydroxychromene-2-carboxylate isomerase